MFRVPTSWLEEAILQLLREKERLKSENNQFNLQVKQERLASIEIELNSIINLYSEQTGKTLTDFLNERKENIAKEREKTKYYYM